MPDVFYGSACALAGFAIDDLFTAAISLSGSQFRFVSAGSVAGEVTGATGASNPTPLGVLQNAPNAAGIARVRIFGRTQLSGSPNACNLGYGRFISSGSLGSALASIDNACVVLGRWISSSLVSTGGSVLGEAYVNCVGFGASSVGAAAS